MKKRLGKAERGILAEEQDAAESFICSRLQPKGQIEQVQDGKDNVFIQLTFKDLKTLLSLHAIERMTARVPQIQQAIQKR